MEENKTRINYSFLKIFLGICAVVVGVGIYFGGKFFPMVQNAWAMTLGKEGKFSELLSNNTYTSKNPDFSMTYPAGWYMKEIKDDETKDKIVIFSNHEGAENMHKTEDMPQDFLSFATMVIPKSNKMITDLAKNLEKKLKEIAGEQIEYKAGDNKAIKLYIVTEVPKDLEGEEPVLPLGAAFLEDDNFMYIFNTATQIPSGSEGQQKEIEILKSSLESFQFKGGLPGQTEI